MQVTAINVFIEVDGKQCIAFIDADKAELFMGLLGAFQKDVPKRAVLTPLSPKTTQHLIETRMALLESIKEAKAKKGGK